MARLLSCSGLAPDLTHATRPARIPACHLSSWMRLTGLVLHRQFRLNQRDRAFYVARAVQVGFPGPPHAAPNSRRVGAPPASHWSRPAALLLPAFDEHCICTWAPSCLSPANTHTHTHNPHPPPRQALILALIMASLWATITPSAQEGRQVMSLSSLSVQFMIIMSTPQVSGRPQEGRQAAGGWYSSWQAARGQQVQPGSGEKWGGIPDRVGPACVAQPPAFRPPADRPGVCQQAGVLQAARQPLLPRGLLRGVAAAHAAAPELHRGHRLFAAPVLGACTCMEALPYGSTRAPGPCLQRAHVQSGTRHASPARAAPPQISGLTRSAGNFFIFWVILYSISNCGFGAAAVGERSTRGWPAPTAVAGCAPDALFACSPDPGPCSAHPAARTPACRHGRLLPVAGLLGQVNDCGQRLGRPGAGRGRAAGPCLRRQMPEATTAAVGAGVLRAVATRACPPAPLPRRRCSSS